MKEPDLISVSAQPSVAGYMMAGFGFLPFLVLLMSGIRIGMEQVFCVLPGTILMVVLGLFVMVEENDE